METLTKMKRGRKPGLRRKGVKRAGPLMTQAHIERMRTAAARAAAPSEVGAPRLFPDASKYDFWIAEIDYQGKTLRIGSFSPKQHALKMAERWRSTLALDGGLKKRRMPGAESNGGKLGRPKPKPIFMERMK